MQKEGIRSRGVGGSINLKFFEAWEACINGKTCGILHTEVR